ncbi:MAG TPA: RNA polymerase sigma-70 factor [Bacteroidota bacterium]|nr:RNA polymerase sigma-70 factor [Bacteroidota bacterium]
MPHWTGYQNADEARPFELIRAGNSAAFEAVFRSYYPRLCRFAFRLVGSKPLAEEIVQNVFVRLWEKRNDGPPINSLKTYLYQAVKNQAINHLKQEEKWTSIDGDLLETTPDFANPEQEIRQKEILDAVEEAIQLLPPRCRLIFTMHRFDGLSYAEIADVLGISRKTVETQMGRALKSLRRLLIHHLPLLSIFSLSF